MLPNNVLDHARSYVTQGPMSHNDPNSSFNSHHLHNVPPPLDNRLVLAFLSLLVNQMHLMNRFAQ